MLLALRRSLCDLTARHFINEYDVEGEVDREGGLGSREGGSNSREGGLGSSRESGLGSMATAAFNTTTIATDTDTDTDTTTTTTTTAASRLARKEHPYHPPIYQHQPEEIRRNTIAMELLCTDRWGARQSYLLTHAYNLTDSLSHSLVQPHSLTPRYYSSPPPPFQSFL